MLLILIIIFTLIPKEDLGTDIIGMYSHSFFVAFWPALNAKGHKLMSLLYFLRLFVLRLRFEVSKNR